MPEGLALAVPRALHAHGPVSLQDDAVDLGVDQDRDVVPGEDGVEEGARHAVPAAVLDDLVHVAEAVAGDLALAVQVVQHGQAELAESLKAGGRHGQRVGRGLDPDGAAFTAEGGVRGAVPVLDALEEPEPVLVVPPGITGLRGPVVQVGLEGAGPDGGVDAAAAADDAAGVLGHRVVVGAGGRDGHLVPGPDGAQVGEPQPRVQHGRCRIPGARLDQEDLSGGFPLGQRADQGAARAARADHDVVVRPPERPEVAGLSLAHRVQLVRERRGRAAEQQPGGHGPDDEGPAVDEPGDQRALEPVERLVPVHNLRPSRCLDWRAGHFGDLGHAHSGRRRRTSGRRSLPAYERVFRTGRAGPGARW